jgi:cold shock CspA family protein
MSGLSETRSFERVARLRGTMVWFNREKGHGFILTEQEERLVVFESDFADGAVPEGRCGGREVTFDRLAGAADPQAVNVEFPVVLESKRARLRRPR